jgi:hypothetical protein
VSSESGKNFLNDAVVTRGFVNADASDDADVDSGEFASAASIGAAWEEAGGERREEKEVAEEEGAEEGVEEEGEKLYRWRSSFRSSLFVPLSSRMRWRSFSEPLGMRALYLGESTSIFYFMLCIYIFLLCYVMCYVMLCYVMCYVMLCYVMLCYVMLCYVMLGTGLITSGTVLTSGTGKTIFTRGDSHISAVVP